jgi:hypothetical protein
MDITAIRTVLAYLIAPEDTSEGEQFQYYLVRDLPEKKCRKLGILKTCLWICLAVILSLCISRFC